MLEGILFVYKTSISRVEEFENVSEKLMSLAFVSSIPADFLFNFLRLLIFLVAMLPALVSIISMVIEP